MHDIKKLNCELWLERSLEEIWDFHKDPQNLLKISPDFLKMQLLKVPSVLGKGAGFEIRTENKFFRPFLSWDVEYVDWIEEENRKLFVDTQKNGPFHYWKHTHEFKRSSPELVVGEKTFQPKSQGTWIIDHLEYSLKPQFRKFSWVAEKMVRQLFVFRKRRLEKLFKRVES